MANINSYIDFMYVDILEWTFKMLIYNLKNLNMKDQVNYLPIFKHLAFKSEITAQEGSLVKYHNKKY